MSKSSKSTLKIADHDGIWLHSIAKFPLVDPNTLTRFEPGVTTKATPTAWVQMQEAAGIFKLVDDPTKVDAPPPAAKEKAKA
jgi:hypothetical protein